MGGGQGTLQLAHGQDRPAREEARRPQHAGCCPGGPTRGPELGREGCVQGGVRRPAPAPASPARGPGAVAIRAEDARPAGEEVRRVGGHLQGRGGGAPELGPPAWCLLGRRPPPIRTSRDGQTPRHCTPAPLAPRPRALPATETSALSHCCCVSGRGGGCSCGQIGASARGALETPTFSTPSPRGAAGSWPCGEKLGGDEQALIKEPRAWPWRWGCRCPWAVTWRLEGPAQGARRGGRVVSGTRGRASRPGP